MTSRSWALLLVLSTLWGGSFLFVAIAVREVPPLTLVLARVAIAAIVLHVVIRARGLSLPRDFASWRSFACMALLNNAIPFCCIVWGQTRIAGGLASILNATTPLFTVVIAHLANHERVTLRRAIGTALGFAGVLVVIGIDRVGGDLPAMLAVLGAALSYACAGVYGRRFRGSPPLVTATGQTTSSTLMILPLALIVDGAPAIPSAAACAATFALAILCTVVAYAIYFHLLATAGASNALFVTFLVPVSALVLGAVVLGDRIAPRALCGMVVVVLGILAIDGRALRLVRAFGGARAYE